MSYISKQNSIVVSLLNFTKLKKRITITLHKLIQRTHGAVRKTAGRRKVPGSEGGVGDEFGGG
jgi:hypothetical protein